jgi:hypothetical protein
MKCPPVKSRGFTTCGRITTLWHYPQIVKQSRQLAERRVGTSEVVIAHADKAMKNLHDKYYKMIHQKKKVTGP